MTFTYSELRAPRRQHLDPDRPPNAVKDRSDRIPGLAAVSAFLADLERGGLAKPLTTAALRPVRSPYGPFADVTDGLGLAHTGLPYFTASIISRSTFSA